MPAVQDKLIELGVGGGAGSFSITVRLCCHLVCKYSTTVKKMIRFQIRHFRMELHHISSPHMGCPLLQEST